VPRARGECQIRHTGLSFGRTLLTGLPDQQQAGAYDLEFRSGKLESAMHRCRKAQPMADGKRLFRTPARIGKCCAFSVPEVAIRSLQAGPPLLYEAHRRNIASI